MQEIVHIQSDIENNMYKSNVLCCIRGMSCHIGRYVLMTVGR